MRERLTPSRRQWISGLALATASAAIASPQGQQIDSPIPLAQLAPTLRELRDRIHKEMLSRLANDRLRRPNGYLYTVDAAQLMICLAQLRDAEGYAALRQHCVNHIIIDKSDDPLTRGFVLWRYKPGETPDATGTTEALRVAKALWIGSKVFNAPADAELAKLIIAGYGRHASVDEGIFFIRNYFGFGSRSFANNSFLVDYDPDLLRDIADATGDPKLRILADNCVGAVRSAESPCGLIYDLIQPELATLYPELPIPAFSPNDIIAISNSGAVALSVIRSMPELGRKILRFSILRIGELRRYYLGRSGKPVNDSAAAICEYAVLIRIAVALDETDSVTLLLNQCLEQMHWVASKPELCDAFLYTEMLSTLIATLDLIDRQPTTAPTTSPARASNSPP